MIPIEEWSTKMRMQTEQAAQYKRDSYGPPAVQAKVKKKV